MYTLTINDNPPEHYNGNQRTAWDLVCERMAGILNQWYDASTANGARDFVSDALGDEWALWMYRRSFVLPHTVVLSEALLLPEQRITIRRDTPLTFTDEARLVLRELTGTLENQVDRVPVGITNTEVNHGWQER